MNRRSLLRLAPAVAAFMSQDELRLQTPQSATLSRERLRTALSILGIDFADSDLDAMRGRVERALKNYEILRAISIPADVRPPVAFEPLLPGMTMPSRDAVHRATT
jgi:hypothetical protein